MVQRGRKAFYTLHPLFIGYGPSTINTWNYFPLPIRIQHYEKPNDSIHILFCTGNCRETSSISKSYVPDNLFEGILRPWASKASERTSDLPPRLKISEEMNTIDSQTGILQRSAMCVQRFDDSRKAIHTTYRISLRSSSLREPRDPLSKVVSNIFFNTEKIRLKINLGFIKILGYQITSYRGNPSQQPK